MIPYFRTNFEEFLEKIQFFEEPRRKNSHWNASLVKVYEWNESDQLRPTKRNQMTTRMFATKYNNLFCSQVLRLFFGTFNFIYYIKYTKPKVLLASRPCKDNNPTELKIKKGFVRLWSCSAIQMQNAMKSGCQVHLKQVRVVLNGLSNHSQCKKGYGQYCIVTGKLHLVDW